MLYDAEGKRAAERQAQTERDAAREAARKAAREDDERRERIMLRSRGRIRQEVALNKNQEDMSRTFYGQCLVGQVKEQGQNVVGSPNGPE